MALLAESSNLTICNAVEIQWEIILNFKLATVIQHDGHDVIGCVYSIDKENLAELDRQEGVHQNIYKPKEISVVGSDSKEYLCRTYWKIDIADQSDEMRKFELPSKVLK